ncbi:MAG: hypothetical protein ACEPOZ_13405 [Marinifilaceae bacterium]|jgi:hypothetical protein
MKALKFNISVLLFTLFLATSWNASAIEKFTKELRKSYPAQEGTLLSIENKYGSIDINNWEIDSVVIDVTITVESYSEEKAESLFNNIDILFSKSGNNIKAVTEMSHKFKTGKKFSIDYKVNMPDYVQLDLNQKFGDIYINTIRAKTKINLSYGNLKGDKFLYPEEKPVSSINLAYAKATINECNRSKLTLKYSKMNIGSSKGLVVVSRFSQLHLDNNQSVIADSKYDSFNIANTDVFMVSSGQYSDFKIDQVNKRLELALRYGNCKIDYIPKDFESVSINNEYVASKIGIDPDASYTLEAETKYCGVSYPEEAKTITKIVDNSETSLKVIVGPSETPRSRVKIYSKYGNVSLK